jgi:prepilin-type N-terminal cleavage/methylation domain-containing protein
MTTLKTLPQKTFGKRAAFTLIEMMVVISIMVTLATLAALFIPSLKQSNNSAKAAQMVQGQLTHSKQRAMRDQAPRGIRLIPSVDDPTVCSEIAFTEQPPDLAFNHNYQSGPGVNQIVTYALYKKQATMATTFDNFRLYWLPQGLIQPVDPRLPSYPGVKRPSASGIELGDYIEFTVGPIVYSSQILGVVDGPTTADDHLVLQKPVPSILDNPIAPLSLNNVITNFRIIRSIRPLAGEDTVQLPPNMVIDLTLSRPTPTTSWYGLPGIAPASDIVFNSSGGVAANGGQNIILYLRPLDGKPDQHSVIVIHAVTGQIVVHPVAPGADPYYFTRDGRGSGL